MVRLKEAMPAVIETSKKAIELRTQSLTVAGQDLSDVANAFEYLTLAVFQAVAGNDDDAMKTLDRAGVAIDSMADQYDKAVATGMMDGDETSVIIADQRSAIAEIRQMLLVRAGQVEEALVVAEQSRGAAQAEVLKRRLGIEQNNEGAEITSIEQIQAIADGEKDHADILLADPCFRSHDTWVLHEGSHSELASVAVHLDCSTTAKDRIRFTSASGSH